MVKDNWQDEEFASQWDEGGNCYTNPDRLNQLDLLSHLVEAQLPSHILDLGIGSAQVELALQQNCPNLVDTCNITGVDSSAAMLGIARNTIVHNNLSRVNLIQHDFDSINSLNLESPPDAVICVQALHEVTHETKQALFDWVHGQLRVNQPFIILDRFQYDLSLWERDWQAIWKWMSCRLSNSVMGIDEYHDKYLSKTDHVATLEDYLVWLEQAGFRCICPYYCFNRALIVARKK